VGLIPTSITPVITYILYPPGQKNGNPLGNRGPERGIRQNKYFKKSHVRGVG